MPPGRQLEGGVRHRAKLRNLFLSNCLPASSSNLEHFVWESSLRDWCQFKKVELPCSSLQEALVVIEMVLTNEPDCEHGGAVVKGELRCVLFAGEVTDKFTSTDAPRYWQLVRFMECSAQAETRWRLCDKCQGSTWKAKAVDPERMLARSAAQERMHRWARLCRDGAIELELKPETRVDYGVKYQTWQGKEIFCNSKSLTSRPRCEHEVDGTGYSLRKKKKHGDDAPQLQYHVYFWLMALVCEKIADLVTNIGLDNVQLPKPASFASKKAKDLYNWKSDSGSNNEVERCFSSDAFHKVTEPVWLTELVCSFLQEKAPPNHENAWGFNGLYRVQLGPDGLKTQVGTAVHIFADALPHFRICKMYSPT